MISAIIPVYHNEKTLYENVKLLKLIDLISEVVCVFDGYKYTERDYCILNSIMDCQLISNYPDIKWGNSRARNIGAINASNDHLLFIDVDHTLKFPLNIVLTKSLVYKFKRVLRKTEWHCNTMLMHKDIFFHVGGYDERFCGNYGYEDRHFEFKIRRENYEIRNLNSEVIVLGGGCGLERNKETNKKLFDKLTELIKLK